jgi:hypothetical protein
VLVPDVAPGIPTGEVGGSTLKQNAALLERLRQVAMRTDGPPPLLVVGADTITEPRAMVPPDATVTLTDRDIVAETGTIRRVRAAPGEEEPTVSFPAARRARRRRVWRAASVLAALLALGLLGASTAMLLTGGADTPSATAPRAP